MVTARAVTNENGYVLRGMNGMFNVAESHNAFNQERIKIENDPSVVTKRKSYALGSLLGHHRFGILARHVMDSGVMPHKAVTVVSNTRYFEIETPRKIYSYRLGKIYERRP